MANVTLRALMQTAPYSTLSALRARPTSVTTPLARNAHVSPMTTPSVLLGLWF